MILKVALIVIIVETKGRKESSSLKNQLSNSWIFSTVRLKNTEDASHAMWSNGN